MFVDKVVIVALGSVGALARVTVAVDSVDSVDGCYSSILHGSWCSYSQMWTLEMYQL